MTIQSIDLFEFYLAIEYDDIDTLSKMVNAGWDVNNPDPLYDVPLIYAIKKIHYCLSNILSNMGHI